MRVSEERKLEKKYWSTEIDQTMKEENLEGEERRIMRV